MKLSLSRSEAASPFWLDGVLVRKLRRVASRLGARRHTVDLIVVDDRAIRRLNREYRGRNRATDVISFSYVDPKDQRHGEAESQTTDGVAGEVYVSFETLEKDARRAGLDPAALFLRIGVHGMLHVVGYDHETDSDAASMEGEERRLLMEILRPSEVEELF